MVLESVAVLNLHVFSLYVFIDVMRLEIKCIVIFRAIVIFIIITQARQETRLINMKTEKSARSGVFTSIQISHQTKVMD